MTKYTILGAGITGLSCSYHLGHQNCQIYEQKSHSGGHIYSHIREGFIWDEGPHVSFTENAYVQELFKQSVDGNFLDYQVEVSNYYQGNWIPHPAQSNLFAIPKILREKCLNNFIETRKNINSKALPKHYGEWLESAFGKVFSETFPGSYTRKYWTLAPELLTTNWVGNRIFYPDIETVIRGAVEVNKEGTHYVKKVRYPENGGYMAFAKHMLNGAQVNLNQKVIYINLKLKEIHFSNGHIERYEKLISTIPLPELIKISDPPTDIQIASEKLACTSLLLVNVTANHTTKKPFHWMYVYDEDKFSTRINCVELLSPNNAPSGKTGIQVEVYESKFRKFQMSHSEISAKVCAELIEMGLVDAIETVHTQYIPYANVIFNHERENNQNLILRWLEDYGLVRETDDIEPMTDWTRDCKISYGDIILAGRFGQWKYFWSDDCVLRGRQISLK